MSAPASTTSAATVRQVLLAGTEIALIDVREEDPYAQAHPLWAANLPLARTELEAWRRVPRRDTRVVLFDDGEGLAERALQRWQAMGYTQVSLLEGALDGWRRAGGELFRDVNVPSKAFGEWVEAGRHTPSVTAQELQSLLAQQANMVILDARRFDEYRTMSIPGGVSVPGAELVLHAAAMAPSPDTHIVVNCAGRTRSIIGTQSLINAGLPNRITALRNGTIGWLLADQVLDHGAHRRPPAPTPDQAADAAARARSVADRAGVRRAELAQLAVWRAETSRTSYFLDVRSAEEFERGHLPGFLSAPGGQLVQETDHHAPVRGARIVLSDSDGVRANMSASWLAQMGWEVHVLDDVPEAARSETGPTPVQAPEPVGSIHRLLASEARDWLASYAVAVLDLGSSAAYVKQHIPGAWFVLRSELAQALQQIPPAQAFLLTGTDARAVAYAVHEVAALTGAPVKLLDGGNAAWAAAGLPMEQGETRLASPRTDRYRRPYEGTDAPRSAMQAYLDWEYGLVDQLKRDGTHGFSLV